MNLLIVKCICTKRTQVYGGWMLRCLNVRFHAEKDVFEYAWVLGGGEERRDELGDV